MAEVHAVEVEVEVARDHLGRHGLARAARPREERADAEPTHAPAVGTTAAKPPALVHLGPVPHVDGDLPEHGELGGRQDEVVPRGRGLDALAEVVEAGARLGAARGPERRAEGAQHGERGRQMGLVGLVPARGPRVLRRHGDAARG
jgi:hypothetical protein